MVAWIRQQTARETNIRSYLFRRVFEILSKAPEFETLSVQEDSQKGY